MKELLRYGDMLELDSTLRAGYALRRRGTGDASARAGSVYASKAEGPSADRAAAWRVMPAEAPLGRLGVPVLLGDQVRLRDLEGGSLGVVPDSTVAGYPPGTRSLRSERSGSSEHSVWVFSSPSRPDSGGPILLEETYQLANPQTRLRLFTEGKPEDDGLSTVAFPGPLTHGWSLTSRAELRSIRTRSDIDPLAVDPLGVYESIGPELIRFAEEWYDAGRDGRKESLARRALNEQLEPRLYMLAGWSRRSVDDLVRAVWPEAKAVVEATATRNQAGRREAEDRIYGLVLHEVAEMSRPRTSQADRQAAFDKLIGVLDPDDPDVATARQMMEPYLQEHLPALEPAPHLPTGTLRRRSTSGESLTIPPAQPMPFWLDITIGALSFANPFVGTALNVSRGIAAAFGITIGIGQEYSGGAGGGGSLGAGICIYPSGRLGFYGAVSAAAGAICSLSATWQWTFVDGGIEAFRGPATLYTVSGGEVVVASGGTLHKVPGGQIFGGTAGFGLGVGSPIEFYVSHVHTEVAKR